MINLRFLGASGNVTGSRYLLDTGIKKILVDCGLYQERSLLARNWDPFPVSPSEVDAVYLTHAHLDHSGFLPRFAAAGFKGDIFATEPTVEVARIALLDAAKLYQEDAEKKKERHQKESRKSPHPEIPLYTVEDVNGMFGFFKKVPYDMKIAVDDNIDVVFRNAGHIIGSSMLEFTDKASGKSVVFSGDLGRPVSPVLDAPEKFTGADYLILESTYGDRNHDDPEDIESLLADTINDTVKRTGNIVIPSFAIERAQELVYYLKKMMASNRIPHLMVFLDSPMAIQVMNVFRENPNFLRSDFAAMVEGSDSPFDFPLLHLIETAAESKAINRVRGSAVIIAGAGMCNGGRIKHHLVSNISRPESTILFIGYQAEGTLGREITDGKREVRIFGEHYTVRAKIVQIHGFSGHAGQKEIIGWLSPAAGKTKKIFLVHGEAGALEALKEKIREELAIPVEIAEYNKEVSLN